ncbi:DoxX-like family protein [Hydrogenophaga sp. BPS33]|uniref:DoxX-like family protein n=1 Tax=Hydrogenophaga sp. BPS33 TaxID=2651974 RepID=UPI00131F91CF|nr:DoxX-like family protein [Hydrogenophaga sp. BPS33]QHE84000.1 epimerase [Hydrogenophaga sp. BPS33]
MTPQDREWLRWSLVFVWVSTALVSVWEWRGQSMALLSPLDVRFEQLKPWLIGSGAAVDLLLGVWMAWRPGRRVHAVALSAMILMTAVATLIQPDLWLHPLGPLTKNLPIAAILVVLLRNPGPTR